MNPNDDFLKQSKQQLDDSIEHLDAATLSRLNQARQAALQIKHKKSAGYSIWLPASITAALSLAIINNWVFEQAPENINNMVQETQNIDDLELLTSNTDFELLEDIEFINWLVVDENAG